MVGFFHLALITLALPTGDLYSKVDELKEPDWSEPAPAEADPDSEIEDLKVPDWAEDSTSELVATAENDALYSKLEDLKDPY